MKRVISIIFVLLLIFTLCACEGDVYIYAGGASSATQSGNTSSSAVSSSVSSSNQTSSNEENSVSQSTSSTVSPGKFDPNNPDNYERVPL